MSTHVIGIAGKAGVGKTTLAKLIEGTLDTGPYQCVELLSFAAPLKTIAVEGFKVDRNIIYGDKRAPTQYNCTGREFLQQLGEAGRRIDPDLWIKMLESDPIHSWAFSPEPADAHSAPYLMVIDDVRYVNEADWIKSKGGLVFRLNTPGYTGVPYHDSEIALDHYTKFDGVFTTHAEAERVVLDAAKKILAKT